VATERMHHASASPFAIGERQQDLASKYSLASSGEVRLPRVIAAALAVTWLPLLVLTLIEGTAFGETVKIAFLRDHIVNGRYLLAMPLLLLMDRIVEHRTSLAVERLRAARLIADHDEVLFEEDLATVKRLWHSHRVRWALLLLTCSASALSFAVNQQLELSSWRFTGESAAPRLSAAGLWDLFVAAAFVRFLFLRALWKLAIWVWLLARLSRLRLRLEALHPDRRCGLRFLGTTQLAFIPFVSALAVQLGCFVAVAVRYEGMQPGSFKLTAAAFVVFSLALILGPLLVFARQSWLVQERATIVFGAWATLAARHMTTHLFAAERLPLPGQLSTAEISSMTDASALFDRVLATRPVPITVWHISVVMIATIASMLLPLLALLPMAEILKRLAAILL
jgi:hypothetical protein